MIDPLERPADTFPQVISQIDNLLKKLKPYQIQLVIASLERKYRGKWQ